MGWKTRIEVDWQDMMGWGKRVLLAGAIACTQPSVAAAEPLRAAAYALPEIDTPSLAWAMQRYRPDGVRTWQVRPSDRAVVLTVTNTWPRQPYLDRYRTMDVLGTVVARHRYQLVAMTERGTVVGRYICVDDSPDSLRMPKEKFNNPERQSPCRLSLRVETQLLSG